jgi:hypothetical protein
MPGALAQLVATQYLPASAGVLYTVPQALSNSLALLTSLVLCNVTAGAITVTLYNVPSGGSPGPSNAIIAAASIPANTTWVGRWPGGAVVMPAGSTLQGLASAASSVTVTAGGEVFV